MIELGAYAHVFKDNGPYKHQSDEIHWRDRFDANRQCTRRLFFYVPHDWTQNLATTVDQTPHS